MKNKNPLIIIILIGIVVFLLTFVGISLTRNMGQPESVTSVENAMKKIERASKKIDIHTATPIKEPIEFATTELEDILPDISKYPLSVTPTTDLNVEIFSSTEKAGTGTDGWLIEVAEAFNKSGATVNGQPVSVGVRGIASGVARDYITSGKYRPDAFSPSNELWGQMLMAEGIEIELVEKRLVGNVPGILMSKSAQDQLIREYGAVNIKNITEAVTNNEISMGYTDPFASSTGLNFILTTLHTFDANDILSLDAIEGFETFQMNIPFVSYTTIQMRDAAESGILDGFIMEYQTYINSSDLRSNYVFTPFGYRHDNPLYIIDNPSEEKREIIELFIDFCKTPEMQQLASDYGFNANDNYIPEIDTFSGDTIIQAQKLWKEKKDGSRTITAVFVVDVSGSMQGEPLNNVKQSLQLGSEYINPEHSIGIVSYSDYVTINLPIAPFDINQRSLFTGAVNSLEAAGGTATFDAIIVAAGMLMEAKEANPDTKPLMFVLSDGETNRGHSLKDTTAILEALKIPVHTIGYNANIEALKEISNINEAANIDAESDDVVYKIKNLFNSEM